MRPLARPSRGDEIRAWRGTLQNGVLTVAPGVTIRLAGSDEVRRKRTSVLALAPGDRVIVQAVDMTDWREVVAMEIVAELADGRYDVMALDGQLPRAPAVWVMKCKVARARKGAR